MQNRFIRKTLAFVLMLTLLLAVFCPAGMASFKVKINSSSAKVYAKPSTSSASVKGKVGAKLTCTATSGRWARVTYNGHTGYIQIKYLNLVNRITAYTKTATKIYKSASSSSASVKLPAGTTVYAIGYNGSYIRVQNKSGSVTGYIKSSALSTNSAYKKLAKSGSSSSGSSGGSSGGGSSSGDNADDLIKLAKQFLNRPYGNDEPNSFNCSSLVKYCYSKFGKDVKSNAASQATDSSYRRIDKISDLETADIICFDTNGDGTCDHTALYINSSSFLEASEKAGKVQINEWSSYYKGAFMWARRVF